VTVVMRLDCSVRVTRYRESARQSRPREHGVTRVVLHRALPTGGGSDARDTAPRVKLRPDDAVGIRDRGILVMDNWAAQRNTALEPAAPIVPCGSTRTVSQSPRAGCSLSMTSPEAPVEIVSYDPVWPIKFQQEAAILEEALAPWLVGTIEHIGSTAVPGLAAKPVIDIMAGVQTLVASRSAIAAAAELGYCYWPYQADREHWFCKPSPAFRTHHLHLIPVGTPHWLRPIAFRDYLRAHADIAHEYDALKQRLAKEHRLDREAYTDAKRPFVDRITEVALESGYGRGRTASPSGSHPLAGDGG
jgi:GrpB-like predicted nucleotidyltransferase (UPF0157 family)